jgi:hypothetical protein
MHLLLLGHFLNKNFFSYFRIDNQMWRKEKKAPIYSTPSYGFSRLSSLTERGNCLKRIMNREREREISRLVSYVDFLLFVQLTLEIGRFIGNWGRFVLSYGKLLRCICRISTRSVYSRFVPNALTLTMSRLWCFFEIKENFRQSGTNREDPTRSHSINVSRTSIRSRARTRVCLFCTCTVWSKEKMSNVKNAEKFR